MTSYIRIAIAIGSTLALLAALAAFTSASAQQPCQTLHQVLNRLHNKFGEELIMVGQVTNAPAVMYILRSDDGRRTWTVLYEEAMSGRRCISVVAIGENLTGVIPTEIREEEPGA